MDLLSRISNISAYARNIGCSRQHVWEVLTGRKRASGPMAIRFEIASNGLIGRWELRPDLWDAPRSRKKAS